MMDWQLPLLDNEGNVMESSEQTADATLAWMDGHQHGYLDGYEAGLDVGREQGYEDCLYRIKRMATDIYDPDLEQAIKTLTGEA